MLNRDWRPGVNWRESCLETLKIAGKHDPRASTVPAPRDEHAVVKHEFGGDLQVGAGFREPDLVLAYLRFG